MIKRCIPVLLMFFMVSCAELQQVVNQLPQGSGTSIGNADIAAGLREALNLGIDKQVSKLTAKDGFSRMNW